MQQSNEVEKLRKRIAQLEALVIRSTEKLEKQRDEHVQEMNRTRSLIETLRQSNLQTQNLYQRACAELEEVRRDSDLQARKSRERKKTIAELQTTISFLESPESAASRIRSSTISGSPVPQSHLSRAATLDVPKTSNRGSPPRSPGKDPLKSPKKSATWSKHSFESKQALELLHKNKEPKSPVDIKEESPINGNSKKESRNGGPKKETKSNGKKETKLSDSQKNVTPITVDQNKSTSALLSEKRPRKTKSFEASAIGSSSRNSLVPSPSTPSISNLNGNGFSGNLLQPSASYQGHRRKGSVNDSTSPQGQRINLTVVNERLTITTVVYSDMTVAEVNARIRTRYPAECSRFTLFRKSNRGHLKELSEDKKIGSYRELLDDKQATLFFQEKPPRKAPSGMSLKRLFTRGTKVGISEIDGAIESGNISVLDLGLHSVHDSVLEEYNRAGLAPIHSAVSTQSLAVVETVVKHYQRLGVDLNTPDNFGWTVLHHAVSSKSGGAGDEEILDYLLNLNEVLVDISNGDANTPLHYFCEKFSSPSCQSLGERLIKKAPETVNRKNNNGETPLHKAIFNKTTRVLMVKLLLANHADVNIPNSKAGETPLHYAVRLGRKDILKLLVMAGAVLNMKALDGKTPYELAVELNQEELKSSLHDVTELQEWLNEIHLGEYFRDFLKEELFLDVMALTDNETLDHALNRVGIKSDDVRDHIRTECKRLKDRTSKKDFEARLIKASKAKRLSAGYSPGDLERLDKLRDALGEIQKEKDEDSWLIKHNELEFTKELGNGRSGMVFKGLYKKQKVAIKVLSAHSQESTLTEFRKEFHIMSAVRGPNIVHFFGACLEPRLCIVMEYCSRGSLHSVLEKYDIDWDRGYRFMVEITESLHSLHKNEPPIYHRDMKTLNLLVKNNWTIKICDFGLARFNTTEMMQTMTKLCGTFTYAAPELYHGTTYYTDKSDVFSTGIVFWEIVSRMINGRYEPPYLTEYPHLKKDYQILFHVAKKDLRPTIPESCPLPLKNLILRCFDAEPRKRPNTTEILKELKKMKSSLPLSNSNQ